MAQVEEVYNRLGERPRLSVLILGPPGSGKSLLARAILKLLEDEDNPECVLFADVNGDRRVEISTNQTTEISQ